MSIHRQTSITDEKYSNLNIISGTHLHFYQNHDGHGDVHPSVVLDDAN